MYLCSGIHLCRQFLKLLICIGFSNHKVSISMLLGITFTLNVFFNCFHSEHEQCEGYLRTRNYQWITFLKLIKSLYVFQAPLGTWNANTRIQKTCYQCCHMYGTERFKNYQLFKCCTIFVHNVWIELDRLWHECFNCIKEKLILNFRTLWHRNSSKEFKEISAMITENQWGPSPNNFRCRKWRSELWRRTTFGIKTYTLGRV